ncbi:MAG TPA: GNAT family N-acetyltransferase [Chitinophagaceae bacterium]|nr:GNAT family N-acetyltransferase [Chitinophagaceae bacterium]
MNEILDNPIWHALNTGNRAFATGTGPVRYIRRDVGFFAGLQTNSPSELRTLHGLLPPDSRVILFTPERITVPSGWKLVLEKDLFQMICREPVLLNEEDGGLVPLEEKDVPAMLELTARTNPGPFLPRTIDFGHYEGIFQGAELVAMTGQRLLPDPYTEISAVCTHPGHTGKGYAARLIRSQLARIRAEGRIPILHVYPDNYGAVKLYEKLGFTVRKQIVVYALHSE